MKISGSGGLIYCPKSGHNTDRSRASNKGPDAGPAGAEIRYIPNTDERLDFHMDIILKFCNICVFVFVRELELGYIR